MSRPRVSGAVFALLVSVAFPVVLYAQAVEEYRDRIARLLPRLEEARHAERARADSLRSAVDTQRVGLLTVLSRPTHSVYVAEATQRAWDEMLPMLGDGPALDLGVVFYAEPRNDPDPAYNLFGGEFQIIRYDDEASPGRLANLLVDRVSQQLATLLGPSGQLLGRLTFQPLDTVRRRGLYRTMVTWPSSALRRCYRGDIEACRDALSISDVSDPLDAWYEPGDWRPLVESRRWGRNPTGDLRLCREEHRDGACLRVLRSVPARSLAPLPGAARHLLLDVAVEHGGEGVYRRLLALSDGGLEARLAAVAGVGPDSLIAAWRTALLAARPPSPRMPRQEAWATFIWVVAFSILGLRSTRWR